MFSFSRALATCWLALPFVLGGCASIQTAKPPPVASQPMSVVYAQGASRWSDLPTGAHRLPNSSVIISGHQKGGAAGIMFGALGVLAQSAINADVGKHAVSGLEDALRFDVAGEAEHVTQAALQSGRYGQVFSLQPGSGGPVLSVAPYVSLTFVSDTAVRPYVILKATVKSGAAGAAEWTVRYICCGGAPMPLTGDGSLTDNGGARLKTVLAQETDQAVNLMLSDLAHPYPRDEHKLVAVNANFPFVRPKLKIVGYDLWEDQSSIVFATKASNAVVFAGIEKMDKTSVEISPAP